jgi:peptide/nickel transport system substrate-binding protein
MLKDTTVNTWIFNLRHGVKFHSGRTMNATDVAYSLNYAIAHQSDSGGDTALAFAGAIKQVKIINSYKVEIITNGPDAVLLNQLADLYIIDSKAKPGDPNAGTGPYTVEGDSIKPNATSVNLVASNDYWGGHVYTREVHIQEDATPDQLASDVANGKLDLSGDFDEQQLATVKAKIKNYQLIKVPDLGVSYIELNTEKTTSPLYSLAARQAIGYALNIPTILKAGAILGTQASQLIPSAIPGHDPSIMNTQYNPSKAKQLLSGVPNLSTPISLFYPSGDGGQVAEIAKELDAVGFNVKVSEIGDLGTLVNMEFAGQGDMFYLAYVSSTLDGLDIINNTVAGTQNFSSAELTSLINQTDVAFNPATRNADLYKIEHLVASDIPAVPLYTETRTYILTKPYTIKNNLPDILTGTYFWQTYQQ